MLVSRNLWHKTKQLKFAFRRGGEGGEERNAFSFSVSVGGTKLQYHITSAMQAIQNKQQQKDKPVESCGSQKMLISLFIAQALVYWL